MNSSGTGSSAAFSRPSSSRLRRRGHNRPALRRQALQQRPRPRQHLQVGDVIHLHVLDQLQPLGQIELRLQLHDHVHRPRPMRNLKGLRIRHTIVLRPLPPAPIHAANRADQHAIHVEQNPCELHHHQPAHAASPPQHKRSSPPPAPAAHSPCCSSRSTPAAAARSRSRAAAARSPPHLACPRTLDFRGRT